MARTNFLLAAILAAVLTAPAHAAVSCTFNAGAKTLSISATAIGDGAAVYRTGPTTIGVADDHENVVACLNGTPTVTTIDSITYNDLSSGRTSFFVSEAFGTFGPSATSEGAGNVSEIEITANMASGNDTVSLSTGGGGSQVRIGTPNTGQVGFNLDTGETSQDGNDLLVVGAEEIDVPGGDGTDVVSAQGGAGTGAGLGTAPMLSLQGAGGPDDLTGGAGDDEILGGPGDDQLHGMGGTDMIDGGLGDDTFDGGDGFDTASWFSSPVAVHVDLGLSGSQDTGAGNDTLVAVEAAVGSEGDDVLRAGGAGANLLGADGDDRLIGGAADDGITGGAGLDTIDYGTASAGVGVDIVADGSGTTSGAAGSDEFYGIERIAGSAYADVLKGDQNANRIDGGGGADTIDGRGGDDELLLRDGIGDTADCGDGNDSAHADWPGLDALTGCETTDFAAPPADPAAGQSGGGVAGATNPAATNPGGGVAVPPKSCLAKLRFSTKLDRRLKTARVRLAGKRLKVRRRHGRLSVRVDLRHRKAGVYRLRIVGRTAKGKRLARTRRYRVCG
jgi:Ca2+-binding RTX toxin-like protein